MIKAILMDWNGVVINDEQVQCEAYKEVFRPHGVELTDEGYYARMGMNDVAFTRSVFEESGNQLSDADLEQLVAAKTARWRESLSENVPLFPNVENFIKKCSQEMAVGVVSMANRSEIDHVLDATGLRPFFSVVISAEDIATHKPDPACYREGFRRIDLYRVAKGSLPMVHRDCVVIEDSPAGVQAGKAADLSVLGVANTVSADALRAAGADAIAYDLNDWFPESLRRVFV